MEHRLKVQPYPYQMEGIRFGLAKKRLIIGDEPGLGKSQTLDSLVYTPVGAVRMRDIQVGMPIFGYDGNIHRVIAIFPQGVLPVYKVIFSDGSSAKCSIDHLWNVRDENRRRRGTGWITKTVKEIIDSGITLKTNEKRRKSGRKPILKWEIPLCQPVQYPTKEYIVPPYTMGAYLGDGSINGSYVAFSFPKEKGDILRNIAFELPDGGYIRKRTYDGVDRYNIYFGIEDRYHTPNTYGNEIKRLGLDVKSAEKFIPLQYIQGSESQRMDLLAGLMDTDGSCIRNRTTYHTTSIKLAYDIKELVQSIGGVAIVREYNRTDDGKSIEYQVNIRTDICPFKYNRKKILSWKQNKSFRTARYIASVDYIGEEECQCIKTSAPDELYLTDEYIVTHNTLQSIGIADTARAYPCLVICPSSLKINWQREFEKFTNCKALVLDNATRTTWSYLLQMGMYQVAIVNYESLRKFFVWDIKAGKNFRLKDVVFCPQIKMFRSIIIDESHRVKDPSAQQTIFTKGITSGKEYIMLLSGTPVVNKPQDLVAQLSIMERLTEFGGRGNFLANYDTDDEEALLHLSAELYNRCMIRREKSKVLTDLPDKTRCDLYVDISNREEYDLAQSDLQAYLQEYTECTDWEIRKKMRMEALVKFMTLRSLSAKGKVKQAIDFVNTFLASGKPLILFCSYHAIVDELKKAFPKAVTITGRDSLVEKQAAVDSFQSGHSQLAICSIKAAGVGLTLTAASSVAFLELCWTYADCCQCEDRAHRIGQKDNVTCYYLLGRGTIDRSLYNIIHKKKKIASQIMASEDEIPTDEMYFDELVNSFLYEE